MLERQKSCGIGWVRVRLRILESIHVVFAGRELATTQSFVWSVVGGFTKDVEAFQESWRVMLISIVGGAWRVRMAVIQSVLLLRGCDWAQCEVGMCSQVLLFGRHTWGGRRCGGNSKGQSEMCLGKIMLKKIEQTLMKNSEKEETRKFTLSATWRACIPARTNRRLNRMTRLSPRPQEPCSRVCHWNYQNLLKARIFKSRLNGKSQNVAKGWLST